MKISSNKISICVGIQKRNLKTLEIIIATSYYLEHHQISEDFFGHFVCHQREMKNNG